MNGSLSSDWTEQKTRRKNLQRITVKGHNIRSKHISTANHKLLGVNGIRQHSSDEQNRIKTQGLPLVDGKECHFALGGGGTTFNRHLIVTEQQTQSHQSARLWREQAVKSIRPTGMCHRLFTSPKQALARQERTQISMQARSRQITPCYTDNKSMLMLLSW